MPEITDYVTASGEIDVDAYHAALDAYFAAELGYDFAEVA